MSGRAELDRLEAELARVEDRCFDQGDQSAWAERDALIARIVEIERKVNPDVRADWEADEEARRVAELDWHQRQREEKLRREWEKWRYRRSKLPPDQRPPMMKVGQRECPWCGGYFVPTDMRQRFCSPTHRKLAHKRRG